MGLSLNDEEIHLNMAMVPGVPTQGVRILINFELYKIMLYI